MELTRTGVTFFQNFSNLHVPYGSSQNKNKSLISSATVLIFPLCLE